jgi:predicted RNase H-like HicB family nuclease
VASNLKLISELDADDLVSVQDAKRVAAQAWDVSEALERSRAREAVERFVDSLAERNRKPAHRSSAQP